MRLKILRMDFDLNQDVSINPIWKETENNTKTKVSIPLK